MNFKLDENFGSRTQNIIREAGHQVHTVYEQNLSGAPDTSIYKICSEEKLCLVTLDLDFSDVIRFPPKDSSGIVVIRVPRNPSLSLLERLIREFLQALEREKMESKLWIVEVGRIRIHQSE